MGEGEREGWWLSRSHYGYEENRMYFTSTSASSSSFSPFQPNALLGSDEAWVIAERATEDLISIIHPTVMSEPHREAVIEHVQKLFKARLGHEVFPFGSVPLKTYLPDGDIDLTVLCNPRGEKSLANDVRNVLEAEEQNLAADFEVKDIQFIDAEVKLIKCLVQDIVVDISFNQLGGLCTLCFLEQVDQLIGKDHLFKRSILLIKAWCYYESRILGAHHGLISTYALETLVLYIFNLFRSSLSAPLAVLYRFLDYYSKFDWDNYCISLNGPVNKLYLPEIVAEVPDNVEGELMLDKEFLRYCFEMYSVPSKGDIDLRPFLPKFLNIIDPLRKNNNLGRSVSRGNFFRIKSAFTYGARMLGEILSSPEEDITAQLIKFFANTYNRHGNLQRPDVRLNFPSYATNGEDAGKCIEGTEEANMNSQGLLCNGDHDTKVSWSDRTSGAGTENGRQRYTIEWVSSLSGLETSGYAQENSVSVASPSASPLDLVPGYRDHDSSSSTGGLENLNSMADLTGEYDSHFSNLQFSRWVHEVLFNRKHVQYPPTPPSFRGNQALDTFHRINRGVPPRMNANGFIPGPPFYPASPHIMPGPYGVEEAPKPRGTGTYFPNMNYFGYRERPFPGRGRNGPPMYQSQLRRPIRDNGWAVAPLMTNPIERGSQEPLQDRFVGGPSNGKSGRPESGHVGHPSPRRVSHVNGSSSNTDKAELGTLKHRPPGAPTPETSRQSPSQPAMHVPKSPVGKDQEGSASQAFHLKNDDFPPLSVPPVAVPVRVEEDDNPLKDADFPPLPVSVRH